MIWINSPREHWCVARTDDSSASRLLLCGVALGPLFYLVVSIEILTRTGFDIRRYPLSLLSLGATGWIQVANFLVAGALAAGCAIGMRRTMRNEIGGTATPLLVALYGFGMMMAGIFPPDPLPGFPAGVQEPSETLSWHAAMHGLGFAIAFTSLTLASFVIARRAWVMRRLSFGLYSTLTGVVTCLLVALGMLSPAATGIAFYTVGIVAFGWLSVTAARLYWPAPDFRFARGV